MKEDLLDFGDLGATPKVDFNATIPATFVLDADAGIDGPRARLKTAGGRLWIEAHGQRTALPATWRRLDQPHIRSLGPHGSLIFDSLPNDVENAWLFDRAGRMQRPLELAGALDAVSFGSAGFAVGFHPGGAEANGYPRSPLATDAGIAFFDGSGELVFSLNERLAARRLEVHNVLAMAQFGPNQVIFLPESLWQGERVRDCPIAIYDWSRDELQWWVSPFLDALAVSGHGKKAYVFSPIGFDDEIMSVDLETLATDSVGACSDIYRGLDQGRFLAQIDDSTFSVVDPSLSPEPSVHVSAHGLSTGGGPASSGGLKSGGLKARRSRARLEIVR